tara:strand:+ start:84 stop:605 length:522 start_codon:yes stop_codon:yes gene_type:complete
MKLPTLQEIDDIRQKGMRPQVVGCFVHNKKVLLMYMEKYNLWQFPQGGIDNKEDAITAVKREMAEELGDVFVKKQDGDITCIGMDTLVFPEHKQGSRELVTDAGEEVFMVGKTYFFMILPTTTEEIAIKDTEFDEYIWLPYDQAKRLAENIYQTGKRRMTCNILDRLRDLEMI